MANPAAEIALACVEDMKAKIETVSLVKGKTFWVYSEEDLERTSRLIKKPCVGIMYEGLRSQGTQRAGLATNLGVAVAIIADGKDIANLDRKESIVQLLDQIRNVIRDTNSPTGHKWAFVLESPTMDIANSVVYLQRWSTFTPI